MKIVPVSHGLDDIMGESHSVRSPGLHASAIYNDLYQDLEPKRYTKGTPYDKARMDMGLAIEDLIEEGWTRRHVGARPPEGVTDEGIAYSPDLILFEPDRVVLTELKVTWQSCKECPISESQAEQTKSYLGGKEVRLPVTWDGVSPTTFPPKMDKYFTQMKFYLRNLQRDIPECEWTRLVVLFINANYAPPRPVVLAWELLFSKQEKEECQAMLLNHARHKGML